MCEDTLTTLAAGMAANGFIPGRLPNERTMPARVDNLLPHFCPKTRILARNS